MCAPYLDVLLSSLPYEATSAALQEVAFRWLLVQKPRRCHFFSPLLYRTRPGKPSSYGLVLVVGGPHIPQK